MRERPKNRPIIEIGLNQREGERAQASIDARDEARLHTVVQSADILNEVPDYELKAQWKQLQGHDQQLGDHERRLRSLESSRTSIPISAQLGPASISGNRWAVIFIVLIIASVWMVYLRLQFKHLASPVQIQTTGAGK